MDFENVISMIKMNIAHNLFTDYELDDEINKSLGNFAYSMGVKDTIDIGSSIVNVLTTVDEEDDFMVLVYNVQDNWTVDRHKCLKTDNLKEAITCHHMIVEFIKEIRREAIELHLKETHKPTLWKRILNKIFGGR